MANQFVKFTSRLNSILGRRISAIKLAGSCRTGARESHEQEMRLNRIRHDEAAVTCERWDETLHTIESMLNLQY
jgi:hypothetical protein